MLKFYWSLGRDIVELKAEVRWGAKFLQSLSSDLSKELPGVKSFSPTNLLYIKNFYLLYSPLAKIAPQAGEQMPIAPQVEGQMPTVLGSLPWGHHKLLIDKFLRSRDIDCACYYMEKAIREGWSRAVLLNMLDTRLFEREGNADTNFALTLNEPQSDLAQEMTRDPYCFDFTAMREPYNERVLKDALVNNIQQFLLELGTGFAYMGREFRIEVGQSEQFIDMLFYNVNLRCYVVVEIKTKEFSAAHIGQLGGYVVAVDHQLRKPSDNKTIGLLICKTKDKVLAQYALESSSQPLAVSEYELDRFYPKSVEGIMPSIEDIERHLVQHKH